MAAAAVDGPAGAGPACRFWPGVVWAGLGFLSFAIGVTLSPAAFQRVVATREGRAALATGCAVQFLAKPAIALAVAAAATAAGAPPAVGTGLVLVACVSSAQLATYATFLSAPAASALSITLTAVTTAAGAILTPFLTTCLLGTRAPINPTAVATSIAQIVVAPVGLGLVAALTAPRLVAATRPGLAAAALGVTFLCVAASLASNAGVLGGRGLRSPLCSCSMCLRGRGRSRRRRHTRRRGHAPLPHTPGRHAVQSVGPTAGDEAISTAASGGGDGGGVDGVHDAGRVCGGGRVAAARRGRGGRPSVA